MKLKNIWRTRRAQVNAIAQPAIPPAANDLIDLQNLVKMITGRGSDDLFRVSHDEVADFIQRAAAAGEKVADVQAERAIQQLRLIGFYEYLNRDDVPLPIRFLFCIEITRQMAKRMGML